MNDRLGEPLDANDMIYCMLCRDVAAVDIVGIDILAVGPSD